MATMANRLDANLFKSAIENSRENISIIDLDGRVLFVNQAALDSFEVDDASKFEGADSLAFWPKTTGIQIRQGMEAARRGESVRFEGRGPTASGADKWWDIHIAPVRNGDGEVTSIIATSRDITVVRQARIDAEARDLALARKAAALRSAFEIAHVGGWEVDFRTRDVLFSDELCELLGVPPLPALPISEAQAFWFVEDRVPFEEALDHVERTGERLAFRGRTVAEDGSMRTWRLFGEPVYQDGKCVALRGAGQEITELSDLRERERSAVQAADAMSRFLATMSHELRTPLNGVLGMAQAMARGDLPPAQRERLDVIESSGQALLTLLNDLLDLARIESGKVELEDGVVDTEVLSHIAQTLFSALAQDKDLRFELDLDPSARGCWTGDPVRVRQILQNLISNAVKFTDRGSIAVRIGYQAGRLVIRVADTGIGIPAGKLDQVFDRFVQADASTTRRFGGSGLGLTICRDLAELMGGEIQAESTEGAGASFIVSIPTSPISASAENETHHAAPGSAGSDGPLRILAAEDNLINQLVLKTLLAEVGIEPTLVANGQEALDAWSAGDWDIVLMDIQMPVMDGLAAVQSMRQTERQRRLRHTPVIALTANAMTHHRAEYLTAGMDAVVAKPIDFSSLLETIDAVLGAQHTASAELCRA